MQPADLHDLLRDFARAFRPRSSSTTSRAGTRGVCLMAGALGVVPTSARSAICWFARSRWCCSAVTTCRRARSTRICAVEFAPRRFRRTARSCCQATRRCTTLSPRQQQIMRCVHMGNTNKVIAKTLGISEGTVKIHLRASSSSSARQSRRRGRDLQRLAERLPRSPASRRQSRAAPRARGSRARALARLERAIPRSADNDAPLPARGRAVKPFGQRCAVARRVASFAHTFHAQRVICNSWGSSTHRFRFGLQPVAGSSPRACSRSRCCRNPSAACRTPRFSMCGSASSWRLPCCGHATPGSTTAPSSICSAPR